MLLMLIACTDLPDGWEGAEPIDDLTQSACDGDPYGEYTSSVSGVSAEGGVDVVVDAVPFRCDQEVEGFYKTDGETAHVLLQPVDMHPRSVAKCDCLYRFDLGVPVGASRVVAWRRWDAINDPNDPVEVGEAEISEE